jgi:hypothetical protein
MDPQHWFEPSAITRYITVRKLNGFPFRPWRPSAGCWTASGQSHPFCPEIQPPCKEKKKKTFPGGIQNSNIKNWRVYLFDCQRKVSKTVLAFIKTYSGVEGLTHHMSQFCHPKGNTGYSFVQ